MSEERTFYVDDSIDLFINENMETKEITVYLNYGAVGEKEITLPEEAIMAMAELVESRTAHDLQGK
jgi:hypothetical protein